MTERRNFDVSSGTWLYVRDQAIESLDAARLELEAENTGNDRSHNLRGRIESLKFILDLQTPRPDIETDYDPHI